MHLKPSKLHIGLRTVKTVAAVIISMLLVEIYGTSSSKLIFAMLGAMAAMQPTFNESVESSLTQIVGVLFGALMGVLLSLLPWNSFICAGIGIMLVIILYNIFHIRFSPGLPCYMVVMICTTPDVLPFSYALGRVWDTAIGLVVGMLINTLVFPYDNSRRIRATAESLDKLIIDFLEDMFDGDDHLPGPEQMSRQIDIMDRQLAIFSNQKLVLRLRRQKEELELFRSCEGKARELVAQMEVLSRMEQIGRLDAENHQALLDCGAVLPPCCAFDTPGEMDVVANYHVRQILRLRAELMDALK